VDDDEFAALLQVSSDITKRRNIPRQPAASHALNQPQASHAAGAPIRQPSAFPALGAVIAAVEMKNAQALTSLHLSKPERKGKEGDQRNGKGEGGSKNAQDAGKGKEDSSKPPAHVLRLLAAIAIVALMLLVVIVVTQVDCTGRKNAARAEDERRGDTCCQSCWEWIKRRIRAFKECCCGRRRDAVEFESFERRNARQSAHLLFIGSFMMFVAFVMVGLLGLIDYAGEAQLNFMGKPFPSGHNYFPSHIAELLQDSTTARCKIFFALAFVSGICLLTSWYPWRLRNVDVGDDAVCCCYMPWLSLRQFAPSISLIFMACVPTSRLAVAGHTGTWGQVTVYAYLAACLIFLLSYILSEKHALIFSRLSEQNLVKKKEWTVRMTLISCCSFCFFAFELCGFIDGIITSSGVCCSDVWLAPNSTHVAELMKDAGRSDAAVTEVAMGSHTRVLYDTAKGVALGFKVAQFVLQVYACLFLAMSHLVVWYFCVERTDDAPRPEGTSPTDVPPSSFSRPGNSPTLPVFPRLPSGPGRTRMTSPMTSPTSINLQASVSRRPEQVPLGVDAGTSPSHLDARSNLVYGNQHPIPDSYGYAMAHPTKVM